MKKRKYIIKTITYSNTPLPADAANLLDGLFTGRAVHLFYGPTSTHKLVEVHAISPTHARVMQVDGESSRPLPNWALLDLSKVRSATLSTTPSEAPRPGYKMGDKSLSPNIIAEIDTRP